MRILDASLRHVARRGLVANAVFALRSRPQRTVPARYASCLSHRVVFSFRGGAPIAAGLAALVACAQGVADPNAPSSAALAGAPIAATPSTWAATAVTRLAPLPTTERPAPWLVSPDDAVGADKLLPSRVRAKLGPLVEHFTLDETLRDLRAVCTRFVPCTRSALDASNACADQIRFVLQPIRSGDDGAPYAQDAALHVIYEAPRAAMRALASGLRDDSDAAHTRTLVLDTLAKSELARVTFMANVDVKGNTWDFGGYDVRGDTLIDLTIPRVLETRQRVVLNGSWPFGTSLSPKPAGDPSLGALLDPTRLGILADSAPDAARERTSAAHAAALSIEDPRAHDTRDMDCASCHAAGTARRVAEEITAARGWLALEPPTPIVTGLDTSALEPPAGRTTAEVLRACGYAHRTAVISRRTLLESAVAAVRMGEYGAP